MADGGIPAREHQILFRAPLVRAILAGTKTQTRRIVTPRVPAGTSWQMTHLGDGRLWPHVYQRPTLTSLAPAPCPWGEPGDRLWVRETWQTVLGYADARHSDALVETFAYRADYDGRYGEMGWRPSIHMPRRAARLLLDVTDVRVERLQSISEEDARAEGVERMRPYDDADHREVERTPGYQPPMESHRAAFARLWDSLAPDGARWADDPWVWVVGFRRAEVA